jgi:hypothetical protein
MAIPFTRLFACNRYSLPRKLFNESTIGRDFDERRAAGVDIGLGDCTHQEWD